MRHRKIGRKLNRTWEHRKAMFKNMARSLIEHGRIKTTEPKAKELRRLIDRLVKFGLENTVHARRKAYRILENRTLVKKLFEEIAPRYADRPGGYTRVVKLAIPRRGDCAHLAIVEFVEAGEEGVEKKVIEAKEESIQSKEEDREGISQSPQEGAEEETGGPTGDKE